MARVLVLALFALALLSGTAEALKLFGHQYNVLHLGHRSSEESCARGEVRARTLATCALRCS